MCTRGYHLKGTKKESYWKDKKYGSTDITLVAKEKEKDKLDKEMELLKAMEEKRRLEEKNKAVCNPPKQL